MCEPMNGWKNRETWASMLYLENDQGLQAQAAEAVKGKDLAAAAKSIEDLISSLYTRAGYWEAFGSEWPAGLADTAADIGSLYRVDYYQIAASLLEEAAA